MSLSVYLREGGKVESVEVADEAAVEELLGGKVESVPDPDIEGRVAFRRKNVTDPQPNPGADYALRQQGLAGDYVLAQVKSGKFIDVPGAADFFGL